MLDQQITKTITRNVALIEIPVIRSKKISFIRAKEKVDADKRSYLRSILILVDNELITTNFADTVNLLAEIQKFERGSKQNTYTYTSLKQHNGDVNLKLNLTDGCIYITSAEALAILNMYKYSLQGISLIRVTEDELMLTAEMIATYFNANKMLNKKG